MFWRKHTKLCTRLKADLGAFLEYKGAWETSERGEMEPDKSSSKPEKQSGLQGTEGAWLSAAPR